jgi:alanine dehydrogenase
MVEDVVHYCVANMPAAVPATSTQALGNATLPYAMLLAAGGLDAAVRARPELGPGVNVRAGAVVNRAVAEALRETSGSLDAARGP